MGLYLDNASTTPLLPEVKDFIINNLDTFGNPNSSHKIGDRAKDIIDYSAEKVANLINTNAENIIFTSGGSASNTLAIKGFSEAMQHSKILYSPTCHKSIIEASKRMFVSKSLNVDDTGRIIVSDLERLLEDNILYNTLVVVDLGNSEIGTVQNISLISEVVHRYNAYLYVDCTGSIPYIPLDVQKLNIDMAGFSAHKLGALKGCGVLFKKSDVPLSPLIYGSDDYFSGTQNVLGIGSLGVSAELYPNFYKKINSKNRSILYSELEKRLNNFYLVGSSEYRLPCNLNVCFPGVDSGNVVSILDDKYDIQCSAGSACNNYSSSLSPTLLAIKEKNPSSCVRFSLSGFEKKMELIDAAKKIASVVEGLRYWAEQNTM